MEDRPIRSMMVHMRPCARHAQSNKDKGHVHAKERRRSASPKGPEAGCIEILLIMRRWLCTTRRSAVRVDMHMPAARNVFGSVEEILHGLGQVGGRRCRNPVWGDLLWRTRHAGSVGRLSAYWSWIKLSSTGQKDAVTESASYVLT